MITLEDDTEISPNFLEYMNKCLDVFENDSSLARLVRYMVRGIDEYSPKTIAVMWIASLPVRVILHRNVQQNPCVFLMLRNTELKL